VYESDGVAIMRILRTTAPTPEELQAYYSQDHDEENQ